MSSRRRTILWLTVPAFALAIAAGMWVHTSLRGTSASILTWFGPVERRDLARLATAVGPDRRTEARLTGGFAWGPRPDSRRGDVGGPADAGVRAEALAIAASLAARAREHATAPALAASGTAYLLLADVGSAVAALESSVALDPGAASSWSDLSAAYIERSRLSGSALDLLRGLESAESARTLAPLPEALFNRGVVLEALNLLEPAREAWEHFLRADEGSPWAAEARQRLSAIEAHTERLREGSLIQKARERLLDEVLFKWASANATGVNVRLVEARQLARSTEGSGRDRFAGDVLDAIERGARSPAVRASLVAAHAAYGRARAHYARDEVADAERLFIEAEARSGTTSPLACAARVYRAITRYRQRDADGAAAMLAGVRIAPDCARYPSVWGRATWTLGLLSTLASKHHEAIGHYDRAIEALTEADERPNAGFVRMLRAAQLELVGDAEAAWRARIDAFPEIDRDSPFQSAAQSASRLGWPRAAGVFYEIVASIGRRQQRDTTLADALRSRARALALAGAFHEARQPLAEARALASDHPEQNWDPIRAEIDLAEAEVYLAESAERAVEASTRAIDFFAASRPIRLPDALLARARAYRARGDEPLAEADLGRGISAIEARRAELGEWRLRAQLGDVIQQFGDELVSIRLAAGRTDEAFDAAERLRAGALRPSTEPGGTRESLRSLAAALRADTAMLYYVVLDDETVAWAIGSGASALVRIPAGRNRIAEMVASDPAGNRDTARELGELLLRPFDRVLARTSALVVVPDGPIHLVPFAALPGVSSQYLVEERTIEVSPSASTSAAAGSAAPGLAIGSALVVGNPAFQNAGASPLRSLGEAALEAAAVGEFYRPSLVLTREAASRTAILRELPRHQVFHFAGHSIANNLIPGESKLLVAGPASDAITAVEVSGLPLQQLRLVVLSSCESVTGVTTRSEGPMGLARAFLSAGARTVLASVAPVGDRPSRELATAFHRGFRRGRHPAAALREAQLALLRSSDPGLAAPEHWAYFVVVGAFH